MIRDADPKQFTIVWIDAGKWPVVRPNPLYPDGVDVNMVPEGMVWGCKVAVPYPARRIGHYFIECRLCELKVGVTTAGRPDDPRSVTMPCKNGQ